MFATLKTDTYCEGVSKHFFKVSEWRKIKGTESVRRDLQQETTTVA